MALEKFKAPPLPIPPKEYDSQYFIQLIRVLGLYFSQLDSQSPNIAESYRAINFYGGTFNGDFQGGDVNADTVNFDQANGGDIDAGYIDAFEQRAYYASIDAIWTRRMVASSIMAPNIYGNDFYGSGRYLNVPYNQFLSNVDQAATAVDVATPLELEVTNFPNGIYIAGVDDTDITFTEPGVYSVTYSLSFKNSTNDGQTIDVWIRYNGTDYPNSNSRFFIGPRKSTGVDSYLIAVTTITGIAQNPGDYINIMWRPSDLAVIMEHLPAVTAVPTVTPDIPATPSAIVQVNFVSAEFPPVKRVAPLPVFGFGEVGQVTVVTT